MFGKWALAAALVAGIFSSASGRGDHSYAGNTSSHHGVVLVAAAHAVGLCSSREARAACDVPLHAATPHTVMLLFKFKTFALLGCGCSGRYSREPP
jgi:hypothetical protein